MNNIGIDLGTTNSACCVWKDGRLQMIPNRLGDMLTPSVVHISDTDTVTVGRIARENLILEPDNTAALFKRYMGTNRKIHLNGRNYTAPELSALVLRSLKDDAEVFLGEEVSEIVLSVPAYFNDAQRKASILAAEMADLTVKRLINEPTAAAIAYGLHDTPEHTHFMVLDLGGGTFDVSIMEYFDGVLEVHASVGDTFLGGEDFLQALVSKYLSVLDISKQDIEKSELHRVYQELELVKKLFNTKDTVAIKPFLADQSKTVELSYSDFEAVADPLLQRIRLPIETALRDAKIDPSDLDEILLVGGATRMKLLRKSVVKMFRRMPSTHLNPDEIVAMGAAVQSGLVSRDEALEDFVLTDVTPYSLGVGVLNDNDKTGTVGSLFDPIIERNTSVPVSLEETYFSSVDNQTEINISVFQGESRLVQDNIQLGTLAVKIPRNKAGQERVTVRFSYDINGLLEVDSHIVSTGEKRSMVIQNTSKSLSNKEIQISKEKLSKIKFHPRDAEANRVLIARAERLYEGRLNQERSILSQYLTEFEAILESQDEKQISSARNDFEQILVQFEH